MKLIREHIEFQRGLEPKIAMGTSDSYIYVVAAKGIMTEFKATIEREIGRLEAEILFPNRDFEDNIFKLRIASGKRKGQTTYANKFDTLFGRFWGVEIRNLNESFEFKRGLEPKDAMNTGWEMEAYWENLEAGNEIILKKPIRNFGYKKGMLFVLTHVSKDINGDYGLTYELYTSKTKKKRIREQQNTWSFDLEFFKENFKIHK